MAKKQPKGKGDDEFPVPDILPPAVTLMRGAKVMVQGVPVVLGQDTKVHTHPDNVALIRHLVVRS